MKSIKVVESLYRIVTLAALIVAAIVLYTVVKQDEVIQQQRQMIKLLENQPCPTIR